jgi:putative Holliday junction resolvase
MGIAPKAVLALDVGASRVGVAAASLEARLPRPLAAVPREEIFETLHELAATENAVALVVGLPRGLDGQTTGQTREVEAFVDELKQQVDLPIDLQDEAVTSRQAEAELENRGKPYQKGDIDALAATYILQDWLDGPGREVPA